jgi:hypothetical protein
VSPTELRLSTLGGSDINHVQGVRAGVHRRYDLDVLAFELLRLVLIVELVRSLRGALLKNQFVARLRDLAFKAASGLLCSTSICFRLLRCRARLARSGWRLLRRKIDSKPGQSEQ